MSEGVLGERFIHFSNTNLASYETVAQTLASEVTANVTKRRNTIFNLGID